MYTVFYDIQTGEVISFCRYGGDIDNIKLADNEIECTLEQYSTWQDWCVVDGQLVKRTPEEIASRKQAEIAALAQSQLAAKRAEADTAITPLQDAVDVEMATDTEKTKLVAWKKFRVLLNRVPDQSGWPTDIEWPELPI